MREEQNMKRSFLMMICLFIIQCVGTMNGVSRGKQGMPDIDSSVVVYNPVPIDGKLNTDYLESVSSMRFRLENYRKTIAVVGFIIYKNGMPDNAKIETSCGYKEYDDRAIQLVLEHRYESRTKNGKPINCLAKYTFHYEFY